MRMIACRPDPVTAARGDNPRFPTLLHVVALLVTFKVNWLPVENAALRAETRT